MKGSLYTLIYAAVLGTVCALLLTAVADVTAPFRQANAEAERNRNILKVLQISYPPEVSVSKLVEIFENNVEMKVLGELQFYRYPKGPGQAETVAFAFEGAGLWGPIKGFLALGPEMRTIRGITFYQQEETPGLGGEIASAKFGKQFQGRKIVDASGKVGIVIKGGGEKRAVNEVDAITGATMTCEKVEAMLNSVIEKIVQETGNNG